MSQKPSAACVEQLDKMLATRGRCYVAVQGCSFLICLCLNYNVCHIIK